MSQIFYYLFVALASLIALTVHEYSHGFAADRLGDPTPRAAGRLTLNPIKHLDPIGALCMVFFKFGWARPVPVNTRFFNKPRRDISLVALAGPLSNIILSVIFGFLYVLLESLYFKSTSDNVFMLSFMLNGILFIYIFHLVNLGLALFNLLPIPPLDGSRILTSLLPPKAAYAIAKNERTIYMVFLGWLLLGDVAKTFLLSVPLISQIPALRFIVGIFSLTDMISYAISTISHLLLSLFGLMF